MRGRGYLLIGVSIAVSAPGLMAQAERRPLARTAVFAGSEIETYLRNLQVAGLIHSYPWSARRFIPAEIDALLPGDTSSHPWADRYDWSGAPSLHRPSLAFTQAQATLWVNTAFPFGYGDGAVWAGRGLTLSAQGGVIARYGPVSVSLVPLGSSTTNFDFPLRNNGQTGILHYADGRYPFSIDRPQKFGNSAYTLTSWGQSSVELARWGLAAGFSTANDYWGPASEFPIILGNNAEGFRHLFVGTATPLDLFVARIHLRVLYGRLDQSPYSPRMGEPSRRSGVGGVAVIMPRWPSGIEFGATRFSHHVWAGWGAAPEKLRSVFHFTSRNELLENGLASVFLRWAVPTAGIEVYGEYGTDDFRYDLREVFVEPDHIAGYMVGVRQVARRSNERLRVIRAEIQNLQRGTLVQSRFQAPFYLHSGIIQGHTHHGQVLGSEWGVGGAAAKAAVDWYDPRGRWTIAWSRLLRGEANDSVATSPQHEHGLDVMHTVGFERLFFHGRYEILAGATAVYNFNRNFGRDAFNLNAVLGVRATLP